MTEIVIEHVSKRFGSLTAVDDLQICFADGEVACVLGPSGCGKTTLMRMIAGLETPTAGRIRFGGRDVTGLPTRRRNIGMVFQYPVVYPTLSVAENIALPLRTQRSLSAAARARRVEEILDVLDMRDLKDRFVDELDAGSRQKVSVGRAVVRACDIVLFDEPTTNVEVNAKLQLIRAVKRFAQRARQTIVYVTHDQTEAMTLADRIALMRDGRIVQYDRPERLYDQPTTEFGGWFLGNPGMNFVTAEIGRSGLSAPILSAPLPLPAGIGAGAMVTIGIRPETIAIGIEPGDGSVEGILREQTVAIAGRYLAQVAIADVILKVKSNSRLPVRIGSPVHLRIPRERLLVFVNGNRWPG